MIIQDPYTLKGATVNEKNRLTVESSVRSAQSRVSIEDGKAFQVDSGMIAVTTTDDPILVIQNQSRTDKVVVTYIRLENVGVAARNVDGYFTINLGGSYVSGGTSKLPTNVNTGKGVLAQNINCYTGATAIVLSGTLSEIDRSHCANENCAYNKEGSVVIAPGGLMTIKYKGSAVQGETYARISFYLTENGGA